LSEYNSTPLTKQEMVDNIVLNTMKTQDMSHLFRVKRSGIDRDDIFFTFGKIHGLENIAFADP
jgi:hypothetical protein